MTGTALQRPDDGLTDVPSPLCKGFFHLTQGNLYQDRMDFGLGKGLGLGLDLGLGLGLGLIL